MKRIIALLLALMMVLALCACGGKEEAPEAPAAPPAGEAPAAPPAGEGEGSGEPSGGMEQDFELFAKDGYTKDFDGYKKWVVDAINSTEGPPDIKANDVATVEAMTEETYNTDSLGMYIGWGLITDYETFLK